MPRSSSVLLTIALALGGFCPTTAWSQQLPGEGRYSAWQPTMPPGTAGEWAVRRGLGSPVCMQRVRFVLPDGGRVTLYDGAPEREIVLFAPAQAELLVGPMYRYKISHLPDFPGVELYPSIEMLDRLHPPAGREAEFPIPIALTDDDIRHALTGRLVTKVVYLEQPNRAIPEPAARRDLLLPPRELHPRTNLLHDADLRGRPLAIIRLGGRVPDPQGEDPRFYGVGAPVRAPDAQTPEAAE